MLTGRFDECRCAGSARARATPCLRGKAGSQTLRGLGWGAALAAGIVAVAPSALADIVSTGNVTPIVVTPVPPPPTGSVAGTLFVGTGGPGTVDVDGGSTLSADNLSIGNGGTGVGNGTVTIIGTASGPQTVVNLAGPPDLVTIRNPIEVGQWGTGVLQVSAGAVVNGAIAGGVPNANCLSNVCNSFIGQTAGSTGTLTLTDAGTTASLAGGFFVGTAFVSTVANGGFDFGTPGGIATGNVNVMSGATLNTYQSTLGQVVVTAASLGSEQAFANVVVDGANSVWNVSRNPVTNVQATLNIANQPNATATVDVTNGGRLVVTGSSTGNALDTPAIFMGAGTSTINVHTGGALIVGGDSGRMVVGINGGTATLDIASGGQVYGVGTNGLTFMNVGRVGADGTLNVAGTGSSLTLSGVGSAGTGAGSDGQGAFLTIGRETGSTGTATVTGGGSILIRDAGQNTTTGAAGMNIGRDAGSSGALTISGSGSSLTIQQTGAASVAGTGMIIGRGGHGELTVTGGATVLIDDQSQLAAGGSAGFTIARDAASSGSVTISGAGSSITVNQGGLGTNSPGIVVGRAGSGEMLVTDHATVAVNGTITRNFIVGNAAGGATPGGIGTLTVSDGASISASWFAVGNNTPGGPNGGTGTATIDNATVNIGGIVIDPVTNLVYGGGVRVGRGEGATGTLNLQNGAQININTVVAQSEIYLGGTDSAQGGNGTVAMSGGSSVSFIGSSATPNVVIGQTGIGVWTMDGASTLTMPDDGTIKIGAASTGVGTMEIHGGSNVQTGRMRVGGSGQGTVLMTSGTLGVNNADPGALIVGNNAGASGTFLHSGGTVTTTDLTLGASAGAAGAYLLSGAGILNVAGNAIVGGGNSASAGEPGGLGTFVQTGGNHTVSGSLVIGQGSGAGASAGGAGTYVLSGGTLTVTGPTIVGGGGADSSLGGIGTLFVINGATMNAGTLLGIGHDGTASNAATGTVILDDGASITATNIRIGAGGCLGGNGVVHGTLVMDGPTMGDCDTGITPPVVVTAGGLGTDAGIEGFLKPGRSPGRLVIDGEFQFLSGTIVLDIESDGLGGFLTDQIVFAGGSPLQLANVNIVYAFLGNTDPNAFANAPGSPWVLDTFFKLNADPNGAGPDTGISSLGDLDQIFAGATFAAQSPAYTFEEFDFTPDNGVYDPDTGLSTVVAVPNQVPEPGTLALMLLGTLLILWARRPRAAARRCAGPTDPDA